MARCECGGVRAVRTQFRRRKDGTVTEVKYTLDACARCGYLDGAGEAEAQLISALRVRGTSDIYKLADDMGMTIRTVQRTLARLRQGRRVRRIASDECGNGYADRALWTLDASQQGAS
jgi:DNA-binding MarR family transcriptional regulator